MQDAQDVHVRIWDGEGPYAGMVFFDMRDEHTKRVLAMGCEGSRELCLAKCFQWARDHGYTQIDVLSVGR